MGAVWYRFRAELRTRWRSVFALALLVGGATGVVLVAAAGARRTDTAYSRLSAQTNFWDVLVNPDDGVESGLDSNAVAGLPGVVQVGRLVEFAPGADRKKLFDTARAFVTNANVDPEALTVEGVQRPSDIVAYGRVRSTPLVLACVLAVLAAATVAHALVTSVRRRRRDLALLKTLGFTRGQVSSAVAWQATTVGAFALLLGIPLGIVLGRWGWRALADNLGTVSEPVVPLLAVVLAIPVVLLLVNLVAFVPGRIAARLRPATVLRSE